MRDMRHMRNRMRNHMRNIEEENERWQIFVHNAEDHWRTERSVSVRWQETSRQGISRTNIIITGRRWADSRGRRGDRRIRMKATRYLRKIGSRFAN